MEQDIILEQPKVNFSLKKKLLLSIIGLIFLVISVLSASTIRLFQDDKIAYVYQIQATESVLAGKEFLTLATRAIDTLRQALGAVHPPKKATAQEINALKMLLLNQSQVAGVKIRVLDSSTSAEIEVASLLHPEEATKESGVTNELVQDDVRYLFQNLESLKKNPVSIRNISKTGDAPLLAIHLVEFPDPTLKKSSFVVATAYLSLHHFLTDLKSTKITITDETGIIVWDTDPARMISNASLSADALFANSVQNTLTSGAMEYSDETGAMIGSYFKPGLGIHVLSRIPRMDAMKATYYLMGKIFLLAIGAICGAVIFSIVFAKRLTSPINQLFEATQEVAQGNFKLALNIKSGDEIGALSASFQTMSEKISELIEESQQKVRLENELAIASAVQQTLFPPVLFKDERVIIKSHYQSASECGGDWWGFFNVDDKLAIFIADATGHGLPSALITASARSCFSVMQKLAEEDDLFEFSPGEMLSFANRVVYDSANGKIMMTFFACILDFTTRELSYASAGHNPPWLFQKSGNSYKMKSLTAKGQRLGESQHASDFQEQTVKFGSGDILFLYTDGIIEGKNSKGAQFGKKNVRSLIESNLSNGVEKSIDQLMAAFNKHNGTKPLDDDITLAAAQLL